MNDGEKWANEKKKTRKEIELPIECLTVEKKRKKEWANVSNFLNLSKTVAQ